MASSSEDSDTASPRNEAIADTSAMASSSDTIANSSASTNKPKKDVKHRAFAFDLSVQADVCHSIPVRDQIQLLKDHLRRRTEEKRPHCVQSQIMFFDSSLLSNQSDGIISIPIQLKGYVQTNGSRLSSMKKWLPLAVWKPVPNGLASYSEYRDNVQRSLDTVDPWTQIHIYGSVGLNNFGRKEARIAKQVGYFFLTSTFGPCVSLSV
jgi:hypothetical protein